MVPLRRQSHSRQVRRNRQRLFSWSRWTGDSRGAVAARARVSAAVRGAFAQNLTAGPQQNPLGGVTPELLPLLSQQGGSGAPRCRALCPRRCAGETSARGEQLCPHSGGGWRRRSYPLFPFLDFVFFPVSAVESLASCDVVHSPVHLPRAEVSLQSGSNDSSWRNQGPTRKLPCAVVQSSVLFNNMLKPNE